MIEYDWYIVVEILRKEVDFDEKFFIFHCELTQPSLSDLTALQHLLVYSSTMPKKQIAQASLSRDIMALTFIPGFPTGFSLIKTYNGNGSEVLILKFNFNFSF